MTTVYKYQLIPTQDDDYFVELPIGAEVLCASDQGSDIYIWAMVDTESSDKLLRKFAVFATGQPISNPDDLNYISTVYLPFEALVFHVYEYARTSASHHKTQVRNSI